MAGAGPRAMLSINKVINIPYLSMVTVISEILTILNGLIFRDINLLYKSVANRSVAEVINGGRSVYTYCPV